MTYTIAAGLPGLTGRNDLLKISLKFLSRLMKRDVTWRKREKIATETMIKLHI